MKFIAILASSVILTAVTGVALLKAGIIQFHIPHQAARAPAVATAAAPAREQASPFRQVYEQALAFLEKNAGRTTPGIEKKFKEFLQHDLGLEKQDTDRLMRMSFWKNYVCLQDDGNSHSAIGDEDMQWEQKLKRAGFAAMGLPLLDPMNNKAHQKDKPGEPAKGGRS